MPSAPVPGEENAPAGLGWLLEMLQAAMTGVMTGEDTPVQKANAVARLGNLYLRAYRTAELKQTNKQLTRQIAALEERLAAAEAWAAEQAPSHGARAADPEVANPGAPWTKDLSLSTHPSTALLTLHPDDASPTEMASLAARGPSRASP